MFYMYNYVGDLIKTGADVGLRPALINGIGQYSTSGNSMLFENAIAIYLNWKSVYSPKAASRYRTRLENLSASLPRKVSLSRVKSEDIARFHKKMEVDGYSRATIAYSLTVCKNFFYFWKNRNVPVLDPKEIRSITFTNRIKPAVSHEDFMKMQQVFRGVNSLDEIQMKLVVCMLWDTGMRLSELADMNVSDINSENHEGIGTAQIISKKSARYNLVAWSKETGKLLSKYLQMRAGKNINSEALFVNTHSQKTKRLDVRTIQRWIKNIAQRAGLSKAITPHSFRHGKAHHMLNNGANIRDVQAVLRHINPVTTFHYLSLNEKQFLEMAGKHLRLAI
jgi:site-specific recombinase XerD